MRKLFLFTLTFGITSVGDIACPNDTYNDAPHEAPIAATIRS